MDTDPLRRHARVLIASLVGTAVEYYDFFIYATAAALVFGPLYFPAENAAAQTLLAFMSFGLAFLARPLGAIAFGHFGDRVGRKSTLVASLLTMGVCTLAIAFLPTYAQVGWIAPLLLCVLRFGQGFGLGGEWGGASLLAVEYAPKGWESRFGAVPQLGVPIGSCAATGVFLAMGALLDETQFLAWGWRIPFAVSALLVALGLWVRLRIAETPEFRAVLAREAPLPVPLLTLLKKHLGALLASSAGVVSTFALFYLATAYALAEGTGPLGYSRPSFLLLQLIANVFLVIGILLAAWHADATTPGRTIARGALATAAIGLVFSMALASGSLLIVGVLLCGAMFVLGFNNAPLGRWQATLFPVHVRYSGLSLSFSVGGVLGGAMTPIVAQSMSVAGFGQGTGLLLTAAGAVTIVAVWRARPLASVERPASAAPPEPHAEDLLRS